MLEEAYEAAEAVTPGDNASHPIFGSASHACRALYIGGAGDVTAIVDGAAVLFKAVPVGTVLEVNASSVNATGTTATNIVALA